MADGSTLSLHSKSLYNHRHTVTLHRLLDFSAIFRQACGDLLPRLLLDLNHDRIYWYCCILHNGMQTKLSSKITSQMDSSLLIYIVRSLHNSINCICTIATHRPLIDGFDSCNDLYHRSLCYDNQERLH